MITTGESVHQYRRPRAKAHMSLFPASDVEPALLVHALAESGNAGCERPCPTRSTRFLTMFPRRSITRTQKVRNGRMCKGERPCHIHSGLRRVDGDYMCVDAPEFTIMRMPGDGCDGEAEEIRPRLKNKGIACVRKSVA